jgi:hypothetical protein
MLVDLNGLAQPAVGTQPHWAMFTAVAGHADIFDPLRAEVVRLVNAALAANPQRPFIDSRQAGADALLALSTWWHGEFPRRFPQFPNGAERGIFGMTLWNYLATHPDRWCFAGVADAHGYGQDATQYWRVRGERADA